MDGKELGKRIRSIRLMKKMTQSEVVGDFITRNMLSKIESGAAVPSLQTLEHLAEALEVPVSQLVPNQSDDAASISLLYRAKQAVAGEEYQEALELIEKLPTDLYDESEAIGAKANLGLAGQLAKQKELRSAVVYAKAALEMSQNGLYASRELQTQALLLLDQIAQSMGVGLE